MNSNQRKTAGLFIFIICMILCGSVFAQTVKVHKLSTIPVLDGSDDDWRDIPGTEIPLYSIVDNKKPDIDMVVVKAGIAGGNIYFLAKWKDDTKNDSTHKPFSWNAAKNKYIAGTEMEDRFAMQFAMEGDYSADWLSGNSFKADMWHWKAFRSNSIGLTHDKMTIVTFDKVKKAYKTVARDGRTVYISRPGDEGSKLYKTKRYSKKEDDVMPKYILNKNASGSVADIKAKGVWKEGIWTLEQKRKMNTGHPDDVVFAENSVVKGAVAAFDHVAGGKEDVSQTLLFQF